MEVETERNRTFDGRKIQEQAQQHSREVGTLLLTYRPASKNDGDNGSIHVIAGSSFSCFSRDPGLAVIRLWILGPGWYITALGTVYGSTCRRARTCNRL